MSTPTRRQTPRPLKTSRPATAPRFTTTAACTAEVSERAGRTGLEAIAMRAVNTMYRTVTDALVEEGYEVGVLEGLIRVRTEYEPQAMLQRISVEFPAEPVAGDEVIFIGGPADQQIWVLPDETPREIAVTVNGKAPAWYTRCAVNTARGIWEYHRARD